MNVTELIKAVTSWSALVAALAIFGFAPRAMLRLIVLAFPREDPRRDELLAELHVVSRWERPFWVIEQLEVALCEGACGRLIRVSTGRVIHRWHIRSGVETNRKFPSSFLIPNSNEKDAIRPGDAVKVMFVMRDGWCERMWITITAVKRKKLTGILEDTPLFIPRLTSGRILRLKRDHVIDIVPSADALGSIEYAEARHRYGYLEQIKNGSTFHRPNNNRHGYEAHYFPDD
jgi:hypothetical protein